MYDIPILFIVFRRPETTLRVFNKIREIRPKKLYISCNAPDLLNLDEVSRCQQVKKIFENIDWECEVHTRFREIPVDSRTSIEKAIDWLFEKEDFGVILEDDVLPDISFFEYCRQLLVKYQNNTEIFGISGNSFIKANKCDYDYYFSQYIHIWGWATWRRSWILYENNLKKYNKQYLMGVISAVNNNDDFLKYWCERFCGDDLTYDFALHFSLWKNKKYMIAPAINLVRNIGFGGHATHTLDDGGWIGRLKSKEIKFPLKHPPYLELNFNNDRWEDVHVFRIRKDPLRKMLTNFPLLYSLIKYCYRKIIK